VRHLVFRTGDLSFDPHWATCVRVMAPGQFGNRSHARLYSIMDLERRKRRHRVRHLRAPLQLHRRVQWRGIQGCGLELPVRPAARRRIEFAGPVGYPFVIPEDKTADILMLGMGTGIAPFRTLIRRIYEKIGGWKGRYGCSTARAARWKCST
jgi:hypothetical protein